MGHDEVWRMKTKLLSSTPGNTATIHIKTPHPNVIISYREGVHLSQARPILISCLIWKEPNLSQKLVRLGSEGHSGMSEGCEQKKSKGAEQNLSKKPRLFLLVPQLWACRNVRCWKSGWRNSGWVVAWLRGDERARRDARMNRRRMW